MNTAVVELFEGTDLCFGIQFYDKDDAVRIVHLTSESAFEISETLDGTGDFKIQADGHPVSGGKLKPTYLTGQPLLRGCVSELEVAVDVKKTALRMGVVNRPAYLQLAQESSGSRSFYSSKTTDCVAFCSMMKKGAELTYGKIQHAKMAAVIVSAGDTVRLKVDRTNLRKLALMKVYVNTVKVGEMTLPADWADMCFGVQFFDHADTVRIVKQPATFCENVDAKPLVAPPIVLAAAAPLTSFPGVYGSPPAYWERVSSTQAGNIDTHTLPTSSSVYAEVLKLFAATASASKYDVVSLSIVRDLGRFNQYNAKKQFMLSNLGSAKALNERWLWHGTAEPLVVQILTNGFLRDFSATAAYGDGKSV